MKRSTLIAGILIVVAALIVMVRALSTPAAIPQVTLNDAERLALQELQELTPEAVAKMSETKKKEVFAVMENLAAKIGDTVLHEDMPDNDLQRVAVGSLRGTDAEHPASGKVIVARQPDGAHFVRLDGITVKPGINLHVLLVHDKEGDLNRGASVDLGTLKASTGEHNYDIPEDIDVDQFQSVIIRSPAMGVTFAVASL